MLIITITIFSNLIGAFNALFFINHWVGLKSDSVMGPPAIDENPEIVHISYDDVTLNVIYQIKSTFKPTCSSSLGKVLPLT